MKSKLEAMLIAVFFCLPGLFGQLDNIMLNSEMIESRVKQIVLPGRFVMEYTEQGNSSGVPVIFLHGFADSRLSYQKLLPYLSGSIHAYVLSMRGHGNSGRPESGYSPEEFSADVVEFMKHLNIQEAFFVGHSLGATVVQRFVIDHPRLVKGIILEGSLSGFRNNAIIREMEPVIAGLSDPVDSFFVYEFQKSMIEKFISSQELKLYVDESLKLPSFVWKSVLSGFKEVDYSSELYKVKSPALLIWGDKDIVTLRKDQEVLQNAMRGSQLKVYEGTGHSVHWEDPERFARDIESFIFPK